jgi:hypothetical protein
LNSWRAANSFPHLQQHNQAGMVGPLKAPRLDRSSG